MDYLKKQLQQLDQKIADLKSLLKDPELTELATQEIKELEKQKIELAQSAQTPMESVQTSDTDSKSDEINPNVAIMEIRSAAGGDEAGIFAGNLLRMYERFAEFKKWSYEELDRSEGKLGQIKEVVIKIKRKNKYPSLQ